METVLEILFEKAVTSNIKKDYVMHKEFIHAIMSIADIKNLAEEFLDEDYFDRALNPVKGLKKYEELILKNYLIETIYNSLFSRIELTIISDDIETFKEMISDDIELFELHELFEEFLQEIEINPYEVNVVTKIEGF